MKTSDFDYHLPELSIAQTPLEPRDSSRLLVLHRDTGNLEHRIFREIGDDLNTRRFAGSEPDARHPSPHLCSQAYRRKSGIVTSASQR